MTAADIRHPLFAAVFCVFTSSCTFALYSKTVSKWLWVQLAGGALSVCLLRSEGIWIILPTLLFVVIFKSVRWWSLDREDSLSIRISVHFEHLDTMKGSTLKKEESLWSDMCAAFLVLSAVGLLFLLTYCVGWALPLGEPDYGHVVGVSMGSQLEGVLPLGGDLTGTEDIGGIIPFEAIATNSIFASLAEWVADGIYSFQSLPLENLTFSWVVYVVLFAAFLLFAIAVAFGWRPRGKGCGEDRTCMIDGYEGTSGSNGFDFRPLILGCSMVMIILIMAFTPRDMTLRYLMPVLAAQPMFFGAIFASLRPAEDDERQ